MLENKAALLVCSTPFAYHVPKIEIQDVMEFDPCAPSVKKRYVIVTTYKLQDNKAYIQ